MEQKAFPTIPCGHEQCIAEVGRGDDEEPLHVYREPMDEETARMLEEWSAIGK